MSTMIIINQVSRSRDKLTELEDALKYSFKDKSLLRDAVNHPSFADSRFELLEFIGDRVLSLVIAKILWKSGPKTERDYAECFVSMTNKDALYNAAKEMMLDKYINWKGTQSHHRTIMQDGCEALIGALFLDSDLQHAEVLIERVWSRIKISGFVELDPKSALQNWAHKEKLSVAYDLVDSSGPPHDRRYVVQLRVGNYDAIAGRGSSIRGAEKDAAAKFLKGNGCA